MWLPSIMTPFVLGVRFFENQGGETEYARYGKCPKSGTGRPRPADAEPQVPAKTEFWIPGVQMQYPEKGPSGKGPMQNTCNSMQNTCTRAMTTGWRNRRALWCRRRCVQRLHNFSKNRGGEANPVPAETRHQRNQGSRRGLPDHDVDWRRPAGRRCRQPLKMYNIVQYQNLTRDVEGNSGRFAIGGNHKKTGPDSPTAEAPAELRSCIGRPAELRSLLIAETKVMMPHRRRQETIRISEEE